MYLCIWVSLNFPMHVCTSDDVLQLGCLYLYANLGLFSFIFVFSCYFSQSFPQSISMIRQSIIFSPLVVLLLGDLR